MVRLECAVQVAGDCTGEGEEIRMKDEHAILPVIEPRCSESVKQTLIKAASSSPNKGSQNQGSPHPVPHGLPMNAPSWLAALFPLTECRLEPLMRNDGELVWHVNLSFEQWSSSPNVPPLTRKERYGKTAIIGEDGLWSVVEIELTRRLCKFGWNVGWLDTYGGAPKAWAAWLVEPESLPSALVRFIRKIDLATKRRGGKPDIVAWQGDSLAGAVFIECKGPGDAIGQKQREWLEAAFDAGMSREQYAVAKWSTK